MSELAVIRTNNYLGMADAMTAAKAMAASGYFADVKEANQALVKILAGQEMGFGAFASMTGVYIIQGRPSIGANLMAAAVKRSRTYDYRVLEMTDNVCELMFLQNGKEIGRSRFDLNDVKKAGTKNLDKYPRNMLFARAMSNGVKWFTPDIFNGAPVYTPEELGADTDQDGNVIDVPVTPPPAAHTPVPAPEPEILRGLSQEAHNELNKIWRTPEPQASQTNRPYQPEVLKQKIASFVSIFEKSGEKPTHGQRSVVPANLEQCFAPDQNAEQIRHSVTKYLIGKTSTNDFTDAEVLAFRKWLNVQKDSGGEWNPDPMAEIEAGLVWRAANIEAGQGDLFGA